MKMYGNLLNSIDANILKVLKLVLQHLASKPT